MSSPVGSVSPKSEPSGRARSGSPDEQDPPARASKNDDDEDEEEDEDEDEDDDDGSRPRKVSQDSEREVPREASERHCRAHELVSTPGADPALRPHFAIHSVHPTTRTRMTTRRRKRRRRRSDLGTREATRRSVTVELT
jgi:hypothetical protein